METVHRDYSSKGVKFYFIYKSLAHPEMDGFVQPITLKERLTHAKAAEKRLGVSIPWLVDDIDNKLKHALGDRPNSEFIIDPEGKIVVKRDWSKPSEVRKDLEKLVGPVENVTTVADLKLKKEMPARPKAEKGILNPLSRSGMMPLVAKPNIDDAAGPFYAKLRVEADRNLMRTGKGRLYLGFHLDPIYQAYWNNKEKPLEFVLEAPDGIQLSAKTGKAQKMEVDADLDPREWMLDVESWPLRETLKLTVVYAACGEEGGCKILKQSYAIEPRQDRDGGSARQRRGFGNRPQGRPGRPGRPLPGNAEMLQRMMRRDRNRDGKLSREEVPQFLRRQFGQADANGDDLLDEAEVKKLIERFRGNRGRGGRGGRP